MKFKKLAILVFILSLVAVFGFPGNSMALTQDEVRELNEATPGTNKVGLGTLLDGVLSTTVRELATFDNSFTVAGTGYVRKFTDSTNAGTSLGAGTVGQVITFALMSTGGGSYVITPDTSSTFSSILLGSRGQGISLKYFGLPIGWIVLGQFTADTGSYNDGSSVILDPVQFE